MYRALLCLAEQHTWWVIPLAALVCGISAYVALRLVQQTAASRGRGRLGWLLAAGFSAGAGIWSTHFIGMLGYDPGVVVGYEPVETGLSLLVAVVTAFAAFSLLVRARAPGRIAGAGTLLGLGIAGMHFTGVAGVQVPGRFAWDPALAGLAVAIGCALSCAALRIHAWATDLRARLLAAGLLAGAIACLHFLAMAAAEVIPDPTFGISSASLPRGALAAGIAGIMFVILAFAVLSLVMERLRCANLALGRQEAALREKTALLDVTLESMDQGLMLVDAEGIVRVCNARALALLDLPPATMRAVPVFREVVAHLASRQAFSRADAASRAWPDDGVADGEARTSEHARPNGSVLEIRTVPLPHGGMVHTYTDVTERRATEARLAHMARQDALTDLPNRTVFQERLEQRLAEIRRHGGVCAVLCLDLDRFKAVNDTFGHLAGDTLLREVAERLRAVLRTEDTVARLGGDEFAVLLAGNVEANHVAALAERLIAAIGAPVRFEADEGAVGLSIGIALAPTDGMQSGTLFKYADRALYRAKAAGRNTYRFHARATEAETVASRAVA